MSTCTTAADLAEYFALPDPATGDPARAGSELGFLRRRVAYLESRVASLEARDRFDAAMDAEREILASVAED